MSPGKTTGENWLDFGLLGARFQMLRGSIDRCQYSSYLFGSAFDLERPTEYDFGMTAKRTASIRRKRAVNYQKRAISMPMHLVSAIEAEVRAKHAASFSAFVSAALAEKLEGDKLQALLDEVWAQEPMTEKERAWADKILGD